MSFFGGGTDYPVWYREHGGAVVATTINKYCYITCRYLPPFFEHKHRIAYSKIETVRDIRDIQHPAVRAVLEFLDVKEGVEIHHDGDLPARTGLGSSSAFTVGLLNSIYALRGQMREKLQLAFDAIHVEQNIIKENVGCQDQVLAATGGFNRINFNTDGSVQVTPVILRTERLEELQSHLMLFFTGFSRHASEIAAEQIKNTPKKKSELLTMRQMVDEAIAVLNNDKTSITDFGKLLHESWDLKRSLTNAISTPQIDNIYKEACGAGAIGGKLLGAGGGGFLLLFAKPELQLGIKKRLENLLYVPFDLETSGSQIVLYQPDGFGR